MADFEVKRFFFQNTDKSSQLCSGNEKELMTMKRFTCIVLLLPVLLLGACGRELVPEPTSSRTPEKGLSHGMIQLGEKLDDPYTVENMQSALAKVYPTKADRIDIVATDLYVRFLPRDDAELKRLQALDLYLMDHPMDYRIVQEGDYYQDPEVGEDAITWQYAVVPRDFKFPPAIRHELLDECYLSEHDPVTRSIEDDIDWSLVEREAFRLTGNEDLWTPVTKGTAAAPEGRVTIEDPGFSGGKPFGVAGVKVVCNVFVKVGSCYTDRDGYYKMEKSFSGRPRYRLVFSNEKGFSIGLNFIVVPASVSTLGKADPEGVDVHVTPEVGDALWRRCVVNNAAYDYYSRCNEADLDILPPPANLRLWIFPDITSSSACMLHHGAFLDNALIKSYLGPWLALIKVFLPDITIGTKEQDYEGIYRAVVHELSHASHYAQVGNEYWTPYINYVIASFVTEGGKAYGTGDGDGAGYCEVSESWAYFMDATLRKDRYGYSLPLYANTFWFKPDILSYLYKRGMSRSEIYRALKPEVTGIDDLKEELITLYPERESELVQCFRNYGK